MTREAKIRIFLNSWQFWMGIAYFGLVVLVFAAYFQNGRIADAQRRADQSETLRLAAISANAAGTYTACIRSIPTLTKANEFIEGVREIQTTLILNATLMHAATASGSPVYRLQEKNIARLKDSGLKLRTLKFPTPTVQECKEQRNAILAQAVIPLVRH